MFLVIKGQTWLNLPECVFYLFQAFFKLLLLWLTQITLLIWILLWLKVHRLVLISTASVVAALCFVVLFLFYPFMLLHCGFAVTFTLCALNRLFHILMFLSPCSSLRYSLCFCNASWEPKGCGFRSWGRGNSAFPSFSCGVLVALALGYLFV